MDFVPHEVSTALYNGISDIIRKLRSTHNRNNWSDYESHDYLSLPVAIEWYKEHSVLSATLLEKDYNKLAEEIQGRYFLYDWYKHYRFTLRYQSINGDIIEEKNRLMDREVVNRKDITIGKIYKVDGFYIRIIETFELIDDDHGCFIAQALTVPELIQMKKGEH
ncbi:hypothetical protein M5X02_30185 [Paenibacillus alvei]|uniref:hypothetical protein n=1 Tax=Paenibacillus alvei TaxID=44250 RepID=UPI00028891D4|nr:hypothetical protein [Paenibacillus alvei]EJW14045.1 hypothetical protein PAV_141p01510 [Paenibacillus alvei DSM 29]MCY9544899.1 hypothetical protein [Paenibacillus alvei]MCY9707800.1 hypothetical protein [Paenibacillus alvei]MEC0082687.1 hypothetical protein [Paenibacillus alvei]